MARSIDETLAVRALSDRDYDSAALKVGAALSDEEKDMCQAITIHGPNYLRREKGWKKDMISRFLDRAEVKAEIESLRRQYEDRAGIQERTQFFAQLKINSMVPTALKVLAKTLRGKTVDKDGREIDPPSMAQFQAAQVVLDRANIQGQKYAGNDSTPAIDARSVHVSLGGTGGDSAGGLDSESRAKVASIVNSVIHGVRAEAEAGRVVKRRALEQARDGTDDDDEPDAVREQPVQQEKPRKRRYVEPDPDED